MKKKIFTLLFTLVAIATTAQVQVYVPGERVSTILENTKYFIFNTAYTPGGNSNRWGFVYYDGRVKTYSGAVPESFVTDNTNYLFTFANNGNGTYTLTNGGMQKEVGNMFTITPWMDAEDRGDAQVRNDDGTFTPNDEISEANKVWTIYNGNAYWNGNNWYSIGTNSFATWSDAHPYAIYTCIEMTTVTVIYNLYGPDKSLIKSEEVQQLPNRAVAIPAALIEGCGYNKLLYDFTPSRETIGEENCEIDVQITLKEGIVTDLADLSNNKAYLLSTERGSLGSNGTQMVSTKVTIYEASNFAIINYENNYYLWSIADGKWVSSNSQPTLTDDLSEVEPLFFSTVDENGEPLDNSFYFIGMGEKGVNVTGSYMSGIVINSQTSRNPGNIYVIKENGEFDPTNALAALEKGSDGPNPVTFGDRIPIQERQVGEKTYQLYKAISKSRVRTNGDCAPFHLTQTTLDITDETGTESFVIDEGTIYTDERSSNWICMMIDLDAEKIYVFSNSKDANYSNYGMDGYVYSSPLNEPAFSRETVFSNANWGWYSFFGGVTDDGQPILRHFSYAGYYDVASTRTEDGTWKHVSVGSIRPDAANDRWNSVEKILVVGGSSEEDIDPVDENDNVDFGSDMDENSNLDGNVIGDIFYNISSGNGEYNSEEGCIVVTKPTDDGTVDDLEGKDIFGEDFKSQFTGIVFKVPAGKGTVKVNAETTGNMTLKVKIGSNDPVEMELDGKLKVTFPYNVSEPTYVYIYAGAANEAKGFGKASATDAALKIYGIEFLRDDVTGIDRPTPDPSLNGGESWYTIDGVKLNGEPTKKGVYIVKGKKVKKVKR
ncbi:MAG: hypothetical protein IK067_07660 [Prevotella sp.]|nr:hypothetical protein [Prevotella sp.]